MTGHPDLMGSTIGVQLSIPLRDRAAQSTALGARVGLQQAELSLEQLRETVGQQIRDVVRDVSIRWRQLELARRSRALAEQSLEVEMIKLRNGRTTNFQVLSIENDLRGAETAELGAVIAYLNALATLDQQLGTTLDTWSISLND
jgi:outer membrane protein TolC